MGKRPSAGRLPFFMHEQHLLYVVLGGEVRLACGKQTCVVRKNEMVLLRRAHSVSYEKQGIIACRRCRGRPGTLFS